MEIYGNKLIILRGNSGSGKSTVADRLRSESGRRIAIIDQDHLRAYILQEKEFEGGDTADLIEQMAGFALARHYDVILEGILYSPKYGEMLQRLMAKCPDNHPYYFDISLEETLRRSSTKLAGSAPSEHELREWYRPGDISDLPGEKVVSESSTLEQTVRMILRETGLK
jgi:adenylylsulfate kinase-like enzyme